MPFSGFTSINFISNYRVCHFDKSPKMSTYLVAFIVGEFEAVEVSFVNPILCIICYENINFSILFFRANPKMVPLFGFIHLWARLSRANLLYRLVLDPLNITRNSLELNIPFQSMFLVWCWCPSKINIFGNFMFLIINSNMNILMMTSVIVNDKTIIIF